jgi:hypothetical protein
VKTRLTPEREQEIREAILNDRKNVADLSQKGFYVLGKFPIEAFELLAEIDALRAENDDNFLKKVNYRNERDQLKVENESLMALMEGSCLIEENQKLREEIDHQRRKTENIIYNTNEREKKLRDRISKLRESLEWIMPKVHQGNNDWFFDQCTKVTCSEYHKALAQDDEMEGKG